MVNLLHFQIAVCGDPTVAVNGEHSTIQRKTELHMALQRLSSHSDSTTLPHLFLFVCLFCGLVWFGFVKKRALFFKPFQYFVKLLVSHKTENVFTELVQIITVATSLYYKAFQMEYLDCANFNVKIELPTCGFSLLSLLLCYSKQEFYPNTNECFLQFSPPLFRVFSLWIALVTTIVLHNNGKKIYRRFSQFISSNY